MLDRSVFPLCVDFDMEIDVVVDDVFAGDAEEFAGAVLVVAMQVCDRKPSFLKSGYAMEGWSSCRMQGPRLMARWPGMRYSARMP